MASSKRFLFVLAIFGLGANITACSMFSDHNLDPSKNNQANFRKDLRECKEDYPEMGSGVHVRQWQGCMQLKGWK
jgi:hypothetical protein